MRLFLVLLALWLLLNQSLAPGHLLLGAALAFGGCVVFARLQPRGSGISSRPLAMLRLLGLVLGDVVRSNIAVGRIVFGLGSRNRTSGFLILPLEVRHPGALAVLACIITATPGTSWMRYDGGTNTITIHVLDLVDEAAWIRLFKERYERRLMEIFE